MPFITLTFLLFIAVQRVKHASLHNLDTTETVLEIRLNVLKLLK